MEKRLSEEHHFFFIFYSSCPGTDDNADDADDDGDNRDFKIRRLRTTTTVKHATAHDQNHMTVHFSHVVLRLR